MLSIWWAHTTGLLPKQDMGLSHIFFAIALYLSLLIHLTDCPSNKILTGSYPQAIRGSGIAPGVGMIKSADDADADECWVPAEWQACYRWLCL